MNGDEDGVLEAARAIRPYLNDLVGQAAAETLDRHIAGELAGQAGRMATSVRLRALLEQQEDTAWFLSQVLADEPQYRPPYYQPATTRDVSLAGDSGPAAADRYACPLGDYAWYRPDIGTPVPQCPTHRISVTRS